MSVLNVIRFDALFWFLKITTRYINTVLVYGKKIVTNSLPRNMTFNIPVSVFTTEISLVGL